MTGTTGADPAPRLIRRLPITVLVRAHADASTDVDLRAHPDRPALHQCLASLTGFGQVLIVRDVPRSSSRADAAAAFQRCLVTARVEHEWVLLLDQHDVVSSHLAAELSALFHLGIPAHDGYVLRRTGGGRLRPSGPGRHTPRLLARRSVLTWRHGRPDVAGTTSRLRGRLEVPQQVIAGLLPVVSAYAAGTFANRSHPSF